MSDNLTTAVSETTVTNGKTRITTKDPALKLAHRRLSVLQLAEALGNVSEACRRSGMDRTSYYEYKQRFQAFGVEGLKDLPPIHKTHPQTTPPQVMEKVLALSMANPARGCVWLSDKLKLEGISVSSPTVQDILIKNGTPAPAPQVLVWASATSACSSWKRKRPRKLWN